MNEGFLQPWHDFFLLVGAAAATLLGLAFVAASIAAGRPNEKLGDRQTRMLWVGPVINAFVRALVVCAIGVVPGLGPTGFGWVLLGLGAIDTARLGVALRGFIKHHQTKDKLEWDDWAWYVGYPFASTALIVAAGGGLLLGYPHALYGLALGVIGHLIVGIHNAWELADWLAMLE